MSTPSIPTGQMIRSARWSRGWSQRRLIDEIVTQGGKRIAQPTLSGIENGVPVPRLMRGPLMRAMPELQQMIDKAAAEEAAADVDEPDRAA